MINKLRLKRLELLESVPLFHKKEIVEESVLLFCQNAKAQFRKCVNFEMKRNFLLRHIEKVVLLKNEVTVYGSIPVLSEAYKDTDQTSEASKVEFCIRGKVDRAHGPKK